MWGKILVATRLEKMVSSRFVQVWSDLLLNGLRPGDTAYSIRGKVAHWASNDVIRRLLESNCDSVFFLDSDADVEADFLSRFRDYEPGWEYDVLQAFYPRRGWPPRAIWIQENALGQTMEMFVTDPDTVQDVAIAGTHACLIKRRVFEQMLGNAEPDSFEWFWYERNVEDSEDGVFSREARRQGFKVGATTHVKAGHICELTTNWDTYNEYLDVSGRRMLNERYKALSLLIANFVGEPQNVVIAKSIRGCQNVLETWQEQQPEGAPEVRAFYGRHDNGYLYDLCNWNCQPGYEDIIKPLLNVNGCRVLVIGAGLGTEVEYLLDRSNRVDVFELPGILRAFLRFRFGDDLNILDANHIKDISASDEYDLIVAIDVLEHVHPTEISYFLNKIKLLLGSKGQFYYHNNFGEQDKYPMHYDHSEVFEKWKAELYEIES